MSRANKQGAEEAATEARESFDVALSLKPAELEELIARLCACGTRRVKPSGLTRVARECGRRVSTEWCRVGDRASRTIRLVDTKFG